MAIDTADVVVIGGGPAGCTVATLLRKYDPTRRIVLIERTRFPRHHVGESTLPDMNAILDKLGVLAKIDGAGFVRKTGITYRWRVDQPMFSDVFATGVLDGMAGRRHPPLPDHSWQIDRSRYDRILLEHARECGVTIEESTHVDGVLRDGDRVAGVRTRGAGGSARKLRAEWVVDCSGQARVVSRALGLTKTGHDLGDVAIYRYYRGMRWIDAVVGSVDASKIFFSATPAGWMWFIPLSDQDVSVGLVTRRELLDGDTDALFDAELATVPEMTSMLQAAVPCQAPGDTEDAPRTITVADWSYSHDRPCGPGYYLAGDAAAFIDPILSSGILLAHHSALLVANAIQTGWSGADMPQRDLHDGYARFYADLYAGFLSMAEWWYRRRKVDGIDEWLRRAVGLARSARGASEVATNDAESFMTFAAGYLTDFRFVNLGIGFGQEGLSASVDGLENRAGAGDRLRRSVADRSVRYRPTYDRAEVEPYLATAVDTERWWQLPLVRFFGTFGERVYRPPFPLRHHTDESVPRALRIIERLTAACDGRRTVDEAVHAVCESMPRENETAVQSFANTVLTDLLMLDLLRVV